MNRHTIITTLILGGAISSGSSNIIAQTIGAEYTTEWHADFKGGYDWLNLLKTTAELPICDMLSVEASTISAAKSGDCTLLNDLLTYSNIEAGNIPLTFARLGLALSIRGSEVFVGINNVNEDYFTSDMTSFFINSSCGISPTLSCNYDIANYPLASWCVHYRQQIGKVALQTSLYPGQGYMRLAGADNLWSLDLKRDGIFSITSIDYNQNGIYCVLGAALHYGVCMGDVDGEQIDTPSSSSTPDKKWSASPWLLTEIHLPHNLGLLAHASFSTVKNGCKSYVGIGSIYYGGRIQPGVSLNYASFTSEKEYAMELGARIPLAAYDAYLQPAIHLISTNNASLQCIGMLRFNLTI